MFNPKKILILTSRTGGGHLSLAEAIRDLLSQQWQKVNAESSQDIAAPEIFIVDPQPNLFHVHYRLASRYALWLWAAEFQFFDTPERALVAHKIFSRLVHHQLNKVLDEVRPDLILTTYPFFSYEVRSVLEKRKSRVQLVMLFSDANGVHASWLSEQRSHMTLATTSENYAQALSAGFPPESLQLVGWPVRAQFSCANLSGRESRTTLLTQLNLDPSRFTIFLQGGSEGAARFERTIANILTTAKQGQIILVTGTNRALFERYKNVPHLATLPFTQEIAPFMAVADVIMGKAGPNILFESIMLSKPFIATAYIPGQEQANLPFIQRHGLGWVACQPQEQRALLTTLIHDPDQIKSMTATVNAYRQWNVKATRRIVPLIYQLLAAPNGVNLTEARRKDTM